MIVRVRRTSSCSWVPNRSVASLTQHPRVGAPCDARGLSLSGLRKYRAGATRHAFVVKLQQTPGSLMLIHLRVLVLADKPEEQQCRRGAPMVRHRFCPFCIPRSFARKLLHARSAASQDRLQHILPRHRPRTLGSRSRHEPAQRPRLQAPRSRPLASTPRLMTMPSLPLPTRPPSRSTLVGVGMAASRSCARLFSTMGLPTAAMAATEGMYTSKLSTARRP